MIMKQTLLALSLICILSCPLANAKTTDNSLDKIIVVLNDDVVTQSELDHALSMIKMQIAQEHISMPPEDVLHKQVLDQLINKKLQLQLAKQSGIAISDKEIDQTVGNIAAKNNMSVTDFYQRINHEGMATADYRNEMRDQMTVQKLQQQEVISHLSVAPAEVDSFMRSKLWQANGAKEYHLEDILIPVSDTPSSEELSAARKRASLIVAKLHQGQNFQSIAQTESGDQHALKGGDLGWRKLPEIPTAFAEQVVNLQAKDIAGPIQTANGFHVLRLAGVRADGKQAQPDKKQIENLLLQRKFEEAMQNWVSRLRSQAFINVTQA